MSGRIVITGAGGQLGSCLAAQATDQGRDVLALTSSQWNITDPAAAESIVKSGDVVINCAAYTNVDGAESDEEAAYAVNAAGPEHIARSCARAGAQLLHVSTDYVFDAQPGAAPHPFEPSDPTTPVGVYGHSKRAGEEAVLAALPDAGQGIVVRTAWVYTGGTGKDFVAVMQRLAAGENPVDVVDDQTGSPTYVADLAAALLQIADDRVPGPILHAANEGAVSRFEQARAVFEECGADPARVRPVSSAHNPRPAPRPSYSALSSRESAAAGMTPLRPWRAALVAALAASGRVASPDRPIPSSRG
ncbi:dTDP-4-dehydrorhamnose reductase [Mycobacterium numidiamassiliense]|uniref:dTDP-4-dehydrorhamnose reductase n=1 Tax=Mycobacterium numidiamassiliense TaxID=1841861 RepID=A0A2U3P3R1_9MYCO|nr:dTDP-4-dehydrorhamnose reductase [Mycobacterium numidiamassiliense]SPM38374.1 dTDP-4-dehydrorhamnose reductase [Mycobacterium numidiamassiliense]